MSPNKYKWILYLIVLVIASTIAIQIYWNYKNYQVNRQQLINDVQVSLDNAVDEYYTKLAQNSTIGFSFDENFEDDFFEEGGILDNLANNIDSISQVEGGIKSLELNKLEGVQVYRGILADSLLKEGHNGFKMKTAHKGINKIEKDSSRLQDFQMLTSKVIISINNDSLNLDKIKDLVQLELGRKEIETEFQVRFKDPLGEEMITDSLMSKASLKTFSKSSFLPTGSELSIRFTNETRLVFKRMLTGILISTVLVLAVISSLFYLLYVIRKQKQLSEIKNDLISNITHEFKTPIATIGAALESLQNFKALEDPEKTRTYLQMSESQLQKLNVMVEKLLETATLDKDSLDISRTEINIHDIATMLVNKYSLNTDNKSITLKSRNSELSVFADSFHIENALNNVLDNAMKYGGEKIEIELKDVDDRIVICISDNGNTLTKSETGRIFDKFYRVPQGNTHDVKGFGIGLYYTKTIIEKHGGSIRVNLKPGITSFIIDLPK